MSPADGFWGEAVDSYLGALGSGNRAAALEVVGRLRAEGHPSLDIMARVLAPAQLRVGQLWVRDEFSVAQEHVATAITELVLGTLAAEQEARADRERRPGPLVVVSCVEQEWHALPALMVAEYLRTDGFSVSYLGANSSAQHLVRHIHELGPVAVLLSCSLSAFLPVVRRQVEAVRETGTPVVVGGSGFDPDGRRARTLGATAFATAGAEAAGIVRGLPRAVPPAGPLGHPGAAEAYLIFGDREALADEVERMLLPRLRTEVQPDPSGEEPWLDVLDDQMPHLVGSVAGALVADDPWVVGDALTWVGTVLENRSAPSGVGAALRGALQDALRDMPVASAMLSAVEQG
ncbi:MAG: cobalamin B12-binding domain-containing protein [Nocardioidaceae bacterium]